MVPPPMSSVYGKRKIGESTFHVSSGDRTRQRREAVTWKRNGRSSYKTATRSYGRSRGGPYSALTKGGNHTHPVYPKPEIRFVDETQVGNIADPVTPPALFQMPSTGSVFCLNDLTNAAAGTSSAFTGYKVMTKSVSYKFQVRLPAITANAVPTSGRVCLIWDKQPNNSATPATWAQIFSASYYLSFMNLQNTSRFTILRNEQFSLSPNGDQVLFFEGFAKINMSSYYPTANNNVPTPPVTGALLVAYISDNSTTANQPTITGIFRVRYIDN